MSKDKATIIVLATIVALYGCTTHQTTAPPTSSVPVVAARVTQRAMPVEVTSIGNVEAVSSVSLRTQVSGQLMEVHFKEGDFVQKGQLLLSIDPRQYQTQVEQASGAIVKDQALLQQAEANLARDSAQEQFARGEADRYASLMEKGLISRDNLDQVRSQAAIAQQTLHADEAAIQSAKASLTLDQGTLKSANLQLGFCSVYSPIDGRTGSIMQKPGNLLKAADVPIVVINQVDPIYVNFTVPQQYWPDLQKHRAGSLRVTATAPQDPGKPQEGTVTFVDNAVDPATGTIHLRATLQNGENRFWPGLFVNVVLRLSEQPNATVVPIQAVTQGQNGTFVYVVNSDNTVEPRPIVSTRATNGLAVIDSGLKPDELVVTDGQTRLNRGTKVQIKDTVTENQRSRS
jgi:multidrug efflux system membrane fusion protein